VFLSNQLHVWIRLCVTKPAATQSIYCMSCTSVVSLFSVVQLSLLLGEHISSYANAAPQRVRRVVFLFDCQQLGVVIGRPKVRRLPVRLLVEPLVPVRRVVRAQTVQ